MHESPCTRSGRSAEGTARLSCELVFSSRKRTFLRSWGDRQSPRLGRRETDEADVDRFISDVLNPELPVDDVALSSIGDLVAGSKSGDGPFFRAEDSDQLERDGRRLAAFGGGRRDRRIDRRRPLPRPTLHDGEHEDEGESAEQDRLPARADGKAFHRSTACSTVRTVRRAGDAGDRGARTLSTPEK